MILKSWKQIRYFGPSEFDDPDVPGSGIHIDARLIMLLDKLRMIIDSPIVPHWQAGGCVDMRGTHGHSAKSYHLYEKGCKACDFHFVTDKNIREQYNYICQAGFGGVGIYGWWDHPGFHVDVRPIYLTQHWVCRDTGRYDYLL